ncbi:hypothetical protein J1614_004432 [Plenodomus biglobosus]|nr:hypothetical protein J1614_004432 [Plenodomus biglobosus]
MFSKTIILTGLAATATAFDCNGHYFSFFNRGGNAMSYQRLDPALYPGTESPHLHSFDGGNALSATTDFAKTQTSTCSTARIKPDKSLYWRPPLFWNGNGTGFYRVPEKSTKIYYKSGDGDKWANVTGFPENFNMMAGIPLKRSDGDNPAGVRWGCHNPDGGSTAIFSNGFPKGFTSCDYGFASEVTFPSCWNGDMLDPKKPHAHMAYPSGFSGVGIENCPSTHRVARFPTIFIEFWYDISSFNGQYGPNDTPWVLSNGDPTGFGFHADFLNGWETGVLEKATGETDGCNCGCGCGQAEIEHCFGAENVNKDTDAEFETCAAMTALDADAMPVLDKLPGCNAIQSGPADATEASGPECKATPNSGSGGQGKPTLSITSTSHTPATSKPTTAPEKNDNKDDIPSSPSSFSSSTPPTHAVYGPSHTSTSTSAPSPTSAKSQSQSQSQSQTPVPILDTQPNNTSCKTPTTITITPTVYVSMSAVASLSGDVSGAGDKVSCAGSVGTVTKSVTETVTKTVVAAISGV